MAKYRALKGMIYMDSEEKKELRRKKYELEMEILYLHSRQVQLEYYLWNEHSDDSAWEVYRAVEDIISMKLEELKKYTQELKKYTQSHLQEDLMEPDLQKKLEYYYQKYGQPKQVINWEYYLGIDTNRNQNEEYLHWARKNILKKDDGTYSYLEAYSEPEMKTEILIDASAFVFTNDLTINAFLWQCQYLLPYTRLRVGWFNKEFYGWHEIKSLKDIESLKCYYPSGGVSDFNIPLDTFSEDADKKVILTEAHKNSRLVYAKMPERPFDAIWLVYGGYEIHPKGGTVKEIPYKMIEDMEEKYTDVLKERDQEECQYRL